MSIDHAGVPAPVLVLVRWRRYGHDRAYIKSGDRDLGYRDLITGEVVCEQPDDIAAVAHASADLYERVQAARHRPKHASDGTANPVTTEPSSAIASPAAASLPVGPQHPSPMPTGPAPGAPVASQPAPGLPDRDLALNLPGQEARAQATLLRQAAPIHTFVARALGVKTEERSWRIGADGEVEIARRLARLPGWRPLFAVPVGDNGSDIDALLIGPGGVFTINAKKHPGAKVWVGGDVVKINGSNQWYVRNSRHEATRAARLLTAAAKFDVEVRGIVAVTGHAGFRVKSQPSNVVTVLEARGLAKHLRPQPPVLGDPSIDRIYDVARHLATWQPTTVRWDEFAS